MKKIQRLNKRESTHALRRGIFYAHEGAIRHRHLQHQTEQAWCLTLAANAVTAWMTEYLGLAVDHMRTQGREVDETLLAHLSPAQSENVGLIGTITVDIDAELAQLDPSCHRPLRQLPQGETLAGV
jgi:Tn3 transposase DDE domain